MPFLQATCKICNKKFWFYTSKTRGKFCSKKCQFIAFRNVGNPNFKRGYRVEKNGYIYEQKPGHPIADNRGRILQHRRIAFDHLSYLPKNCIIHHINENRLDNRIENLAIWDQSSHLKEHDPLLSRYGKSTQFKSPKKKFIPLSSYP